MNGNPNAPIIRDDNMLNIRYIVKNQDTRLWQYLGLPRREYEKDQRRWRLLAPALPRFCEWWREMRETGCVPNSHDVVGLCQPFERAQLLLGGYYNQDPNTGAIQGTMVCYGRVVEELPFQPGGVLYGLPDEEAKIIAP